MKAGRLLARVAVLVVLAAVGAAAGGRAREGGGGVASASARTEVASGMARPTPAAPTWTPAEENVQSCFLASKRTKDADDRARRGLGSTPGPGEWVRYTESTRRGLRAIELTRRGEHATATTVVVQQKDETRRTFDVPLATWTRVRACVERFTVATGPRRCAGVGNDGDDEVLLFRLADSTHQFAHGSSYVDARPEALRACAEVVRSLAWE